MKPRPQTAWPHPQTPPTKFQTRPCNIPYTHVYVVLTRNTTESASVIITALKWRLINNFTLFLWSSNWAWTSGCGQLIIIINRVNGRGPLPRNYVYSYHRLIVIIPAAPISRSLQNCLLRTLLHTIIIIKLLYIKKLVASFKFVQLYKATPTSHLIP